MSTVIRGSDNFDTSDNATQTELGVLTKGVNVDTDGRVTMPYQPAFFAYNVGGSLSMSTGDVNPIFSETYYNIDNQYDATTGKFTAPVAGIYYFSLQVYCHSSSSHNRFKIHTQAGMQFYQIVPSISTDNTTRLSGSLFLNVNDYVYATLQSSGSNSYYRHSNHTNFTGHLVG